MSYKLPFLYILALFVCFQNLVWAQIADFSTNLASGSCNNKTVSFTSLASATTTATSFTFNGGALPTGWTSSPFTVSAFTCPGKNSPDNTSYFWATSTQSGGIYDGERFVETNSVDVSFGGTIEFYIRYGNNEGSGCEQPDAANEEVYLQYSTDNGVSWTTIFDGWNTTSAGNFAWYNWYYNTINIPTGARTTNTKFRWHQPSNSGTSFDNWGLEDVSGTIT